MSGLLNRMSPDDVFVVTLVFGILFLVGTTIVSTVVAVSWRKLRERELVASVVHGMLDAGHNIAEIERVLKASGVYQPRRWEDFCNQVASHVKTHRKRCGGLWTARATS